MPGINAEPEGRTTILVDHVPLSILSLQESVVPWAAVKPDLDIVDFAWVNGGIESADLIAVVLQVERRIVLVHQVATVHVRERSSKNEASLGDVAEGEDHGNKADDGGVQLHVDGSLPGLFWLQEHHKVSALSLSTVLRQVLRN